MIKTTIQSLKNGIANLVGSSNALTYGIIGILAVIGPLFFFPVHGMNILASKGYFVACIAILGVLIAGITILKRGSIVFSKHPLFCILAGISLVSLIGSFFATKFSMALIGYGFETSTWFFMTLLVIFGILAYKTIKNYERTGIIFGGLFVAFGITFLLQAIRFIAGPAFANLGVLGTSTATLVGSWGDLGLFAAIILLIATITLQLGGLKSGIKWIVGITGIAASIILLVMNIGIIWIVLGFMSLLLMLYLFAFAYWDSPSQTYKKEKRVPWYTLTLFIISFVGILFGGFINTFASKHQSLVWNDVRPSFVATLQVGSKSLVHNPAVGYGPNSFGQVWPLTKSKALSGNTFANTDFTAGFSYILSQMVTGGIIGALLWISFIVILGYVIVKRLGQGFEHSIDRYFVISLAACIVFLTAMSLIMVPGIYMLVLWIICIGAFLRLFVPQQEITFSFIKDPRASFFGILGITVLIIATLFGGYIISRKLLSFIHDTRGFNYLAVNDQAKAVDEINLASMYASHDVYHMQLAQLAMTDATRLIGSVTESNKESVSKQAQQVLGIALGHAKLATTQNPANYKNWTVLGDVYRAILTLGVTDALAPAHDAYLEAQKLNPMDATMYLHYANLAIANKDIPTALKNIQESIDFSPTRDAYLLQAQLEISQGQWNAVVTSLKQAIVLDQTSSLLYVYLAVAYEKAGDSESANNIYDQIRKQYTDGDTVINQVRSAFSQNQVSAQPLVSVPTPDAVNPTVAPVVAPQKPTTKTPVAPAAKK